MNELQVLQAEKLRRLRYKLYRLDPFLWCKEVLGEDLVTFKWTERGDEYATHVWDGSEDPLYNAWMSLVRRRWVGVMSATGTGKTHLVARIMLWFLDVYPDSLVLATAPVEKQLSENLWGELGVLLQKYRKIRPNVQSTELNIKPEGKNQACPYEDRWQALGLVSNSGKADESAAKYQGYHRENMLIVVEEAAAIPTAVMNAIKNTASNVTDDTDGVVRRTVDKGNNLIICVGNPDSELDELNKFCGLTRKVDSYRVSAFDHPNVVLNKVVVKGAVTKGSIALREQDYGKDSKLYQSRVRGLTPTDGDDTLIRVAWLRACNPNLDTFTGTLLEGHGAMGIDVSNSENGDKAAIAVGRGNVLQHIDEFPCPNATYLADNVIFSNKELEEMGIPVYNVAKCKDYGVQGSHIGVDGVGIGVATTNRFVERGVRNIQSLQGNQWDAAIPKDKEGKPMYNFVKWRSQGYWELREDIRRGFVVLDIKDAKLWDQVVKELSTAKFELSEGAIRVEGKETIKKRLGGKSPNVADAIMYWNFTRKGYKNNKLAGAMIAA
jgi:phage terminase large subunit